MAKASQRKTLFDNLFGDLILFFRTFVVGAQLFGLAAMVIAAITIGPLFLWLLFQSVGLLVFAATSLVDWLLEAFGADTLQIDPFQIPQHVFTVAGGAYSVVCLAGALVYATLRWADPTFERRSGGPLDIVRNNRFFRHGAMGALASAPFFSMGLHTYFPQLHYFEQESAVSWFASWLFWMQESQSVLTLSFPGVEGFRFSPVSAGGTLAAYHLWVIKVICYTEIASRFVDKFRRIDVRDLKVV